MLIHYNMQKYYYIKKLHKFKIMIKIIKGYVLWIWFHISKSYRQNKEKEANRKIDICEKCEFFDTRFRQCNLCGCLMDVKTKSANNEDCFDGRW